MAGISGALAYDPGQLAGLNPGANNSGMPGTTLGPMSNSGAILGGSAGNPMMPSMPNGQGVNTAAAMPAGSTDPYSTSGATSALAGLGASGGGNPNTGSGQFGYTGTDLAKSIQKSGVAGGAGTALAQFLNTGAGYNPQVAQALIAAMQPQFAKGQANLMEQFGATGQSSSSPAALAMGDYQAQSNLDVGQLLSGLYEQSVTNYMNVLMGMKNTPQPPEWQQALNAVLSGGSQGASSAAVTKYCWIAAEIFDENFTTGIRVNKVRRWLHNHFAKTIIGRVVMAIYVKYGERVAKFIHAYPIFKSIFRPLFELALRKSEVLYG